MTKRDKLDTDWTKHEYKRSLPHLKETKGTENNIIISTRNVNIKL